MPKTNLPKNNIQLGDTIRSERGYCRNCGRGFTGGRTYTVSGITKEMDSYLLLLVDKGRLLRGGFYACDYCPVVIVSKAEQNESR